MPTATSVKRPSREHQIYFRVNQQEAEIIKTRATNAGYSVSEYCRLTTMGLLPNVNVSWVNDELLAPHIPQKVEDLW